MMAGRAGDDGGILDRMTGPGGIWMNFGSRQMAEAKDMGCIRWNRHVVRRIAMVAFQDLRLSQEQRRLMHLTALYCTTIGETC